VEVTLRGGTRLAPTGRGTTISGGYKSVRWRVALGPPDESPLRADLAMAGGPPSVGLSLVQGWFVEALTAVALARSGRVALPAAGFAGSSGVTVVLGRSGAGKTTLTARALAAGGTVLSDDQVVLDAGGRVWRYPRRLRLYPDIEQTAPAAWAGLRPSTRSALRLRGRVRRLTRGFVAPSLAVPPTEIGRSVISGPLPLQSLLVVDRAEDQSIRVNARQLDWVVEQAMSVLADQRARLAQAAGDAWRQTLDGALAAEVRILSQALTGVPATEIVVPRAWGAAQSVAELEAQLDVMRGRAAPPEGRSRPPTR
jgi:hypothetical protein